MKNLSSTKKMMLLCAFCFTLSLGAKLMKQPQCIPGKAWWGVTYMMAKKGYSDEKTAAVGAFGAFHSTMHGFIFGLAFGGPVGATVGLVTSL